MNPLQPRRTAVAGISGRSPHPPRPGSPSQPQPARGVSGLEGVLLLAAMTAGVLLTWVLADSHTGPAYVVGMAVTLLAVGATARAVAPPPPRVLLSDSVQAEALVHVLDLRASGDLSRDDAERLVTVLCPSADAASSAADGSPGTPGSGPEI